MVEQLTLDETFELETPENISLTYTLAGLGSRFAAAMFDTIVLIFIMLLLVFFFILIVAPQVDRISESAASIIVAVWAILTLVLFWGYYIGFELFWNGQTPGKRMLSIRVLRSTGYPATLADVLVRNFVRIIDMLPPVSYGIGVIAVMVTPRGQRLGDLAAGTVVVKDQKRIRLEDLGVELPGISVETLPAPPAPTLPAAPQPDAGAVPPPPRAGASGSQRRAATLPNIEMLRQEDFQAVRMFFERAGRNEIETAALTAIGRRMARALAARINYRAPLQNDQECADFLREVLRHDSL